MAEYDSGTDAALARLVATLPTNAAQLLLGQLDEAPWLNVTFSGATSSLEPRTPCRTCPHHPSDLLGASLPTMVTKTTKELGDAEVDHTWMWRLKRKIRITVL